MLLKQQQKANPEPPFPEAKVTWDLLANYTRRH